MFETVFSLQTNEDASRFFFYGLAIIGGVFGAFLPAFGRLSRLPYFACVILIYASSFGLTYAVGQSVNIPIIFWGYILIGLLSGVATAWVARARSADIVGDGRYAVVGFIPLASLYLIFARGGFEGENITKLQPKGGKFIFGVAALLGGLVSLGAVQTPQTSSENQFAKEVAASIVPARLDNVTVLLRAEAVGDRIKIFHTYEGAPGSLTSASFEQVKMSICADTDIVQIFSQAGVEREFIYLDDEGELIGSFIAGC